MRTHNTVRLIVSFAIIAGLMMGGFTSLTQAVAQSERGHLELEMQFCQQTDESTNDDLCVTVDAPDIDTTFTVTNLTDNKESKLTLDSSLYTDDGNSSYTFQTAAIYDIDDEYEICIENLPGWTEVAVKTGNVDVDGSCATLTLDPGENHLEFNNYENPNEPEPTATEVVVPTEPTADDPTETLATEPSETEIPVPTELVEEPTEAVAPTETETVQPKETVEPMETAIPEIMDPDDTQTEDSTIELSTPEPLTTPPTTSAAGFYGMEPNGNTVNQFNGSNVSCPGVLYSVVIWPAGNRNIPAHEVYGAQYNAPDNATFTNLRVVSNSGNINFSSAGGGNQVTVNGVSFTNNERAYVIFAADISCSGSPKNNGSVRGIGPGGYKQTVPVQLAGSVPLTLASPIITVEQATCLNNNQPSLSVTGNGFTVVSVAPDPLVAGGTMRITIQINVGFYLPAAGVDGWVSVGGGNLSTTRTLDPVEDCETPEPTQTPEPTAIPGYPATFPGVNFSHYSCVDGEAKGRVSLGYTDSIHYVSIVFGDTTIENPSGNSNWVVSEGDAVTILVEVRQGYRFPDPVTGPWPSSWHNPETDRNYEWTLVPGTTDRAQIVVPVVSTGKDCPPVPTIPPVTETPTPDSTETPQVTETPEVTETPNATEPPEVTETPDIEDLETPSPEIPGTPDISTPSPEATETPVSTETPEVIETPTMLPTWSLSDSVCVDDKPVHIYTITPGVGFEDTKVEIGFNSNVFNHITWIEGDDGTVERGTFEVPNATYFTLWTTLRDGFEIPENLTGWTPVGSQFKSTTGTSPNDACTSFPIFSVSEVCNGSVGELRLEPYAPQGGGITFTAIQIDEQIVQWPGTTYIPGGSTVQITYTHLGGNWIWPELPATLPGTDIPGSWIVIQGDTRVFEFVVALELECGTITPEVTETPLPEIPGTPDVEGEGTPSPEIPGTPDVGTPSPEIPGTPDVSTPSPEIPGTPDVEGEGTPSPEVPGTPDVGTPLPEIPGTPDVEGEGTPSPEIPGTPDIEDEGTPSPEVPGTPDVGTPSPEVPGTPDVEGEGTPSPEIPGTPEVEIEGTPSPEIPGTPDVGTPSTEVTEVPVTPEVEIEGTPSPEMPGTPDAGTPSPEVPGTPDIEGEGTPPPEIPGTPDVSTPSPEVPGTPDVEIEGTPSPEIPGTPDVGTPSTEVTEVPGTPDVEIEGTPSPEMPGTPDVGTPSTEVTEVPGTPDVEIESTETPQVPSPDTTEIATPDATVESTPDSMATPGLATPGISGTPEVATPDVGGMYPTSILTPAPTNDPEMTKTPPGIPSDDHTATVLPTDVGKATPIGEFPGTGAGTSGPGTGEISILILTFVALAFIALGVRSNGNNQRLKA